MAKKEPLYPHVPKSQKPKEEETGSGAKYVAADGALTLAKWLARRRETAAGTELTEYEKLAVHLEGADLPSLANEAREIGAKEREVFNGLKSIAKELRRTFPGLR